MAALLAGKDALSADDYICGLLDHVSEYDSLQLKSALETLKDCLCFLRGDVHIPPGIRHMECFKSQPPPHYEVFWSVSLRRNCKAFCCSK